MAMRKKKPRVVKAVRIKFPDKASVVLSPFLYIEAPAAQKNAEAMASSSPPKSIVTPHPV
jgi:hypothetical protein